MNHSVSTRTLRGFLPFIAGLAIALACSDIRAESPATSLRAVRSEPVTVGNRVLFDSEILGQEVAMQIALPTGFELSSADHTYPVVFISGAHGREFFSTLAGIVKHLGDRERMPESIVVSLNELGETPEIHTHGMWGRERLDGSEEGAAKHLRHLELEVIPYLEKTYRANDYRILVGVSGSALFPIYTLTHAPGLFKSHVLVAAADMIGMGYAADETFIDAIAATFRANKDLRAKVYLGTAGRDVEKRPEYRENLRVLDQRLGQLPSVELRIEILPKEDHYAVFIPAVLSALEQNFPDQLWAARYRDLVAQPGDALENIDRYYKELSKEYGFQILPRAERWNSVNCLRFMIQHLIAADRAPEAVRIAQQRIDYRPRSAASYVGLADAYEAAQQTDEAVKALEQAIELSGQEPKGNSEFIKSLRDRIQALTHESAAGSPED